jgi:hypothetical protein
LRRRVVTVVGLLWVVGAAGTVRAQSASNQDLGWANATDFSLTVTDGNSALRSVGLSDKLKYVWPSASFTFEATSVKSDKSDDRYFLVAPGVEFPVGGFPDDPATTLIKPGATPDVSNARLAGLYDRRISGNFFWNTGASWDRNTDAGILQRYIAFVGFGHNWADTDARKFSTSYGVSYTDRKEEKPDPEKAPRLAGARGGWSYLEKFGTTSTTFTSDLTAIMDLAKTSDYSVNTSTGLSVAMNSHLSLKVSLQWLFENRPALETDLDVVAFAEVVNPDGAPGTGDEYYRTLDSGGTKVVLGKADARKDKLDTILRTSLSVSF